MANDTDTKSKPQADTVTRTLKINVWLREEDSESYQRIISSIREYRAALRHCYGILAASRAAGASISWSEDNCTLKPNAAPGLLIAALATDQAKVTKDQPQPGEARVRGEGDSYTVQIGRGACYEIRTELSRMLTNSMSFVIDSARRDLHTAWTAGDPEHPKASRGWLTLQGSRGLAQFNNRGIGFPMATAKPKFGDHGIELKWDKAVGAVDFRFSRLDPESWRTYSAIREAGLGGSGDGLIYKPGTVFLSERYGKIFVLLTYSRPPRSQELDRSRTCRVEFRGTGDTLCTIAGPDGDKTFEVIDSAGVLGWLQQLLQAKLALEKRRAAYGSPSRPWGHRRGWLKAQQVLNGYTLQRERSVHDHNHRWSARILTRAVAWRCGKLVIGKLPERLGGMAGAGGVVNPETGHPWNWSDLKGKLVYKCEELGVELVCE